MRLLQSTPQGGLTFTRDLIEEKDVIPPYAILSHTWEENHDEEIVYNDIKKARGFQKRGYQKLLFCAEQAKRDGLEYFWVDTCCIDKRNAAELSESINSMFRWYKSAARCYVYLSDVSYGSSSEDEPPRSTWKQELRRSRWFTRGWTLQELIAPSIVEFFTIDQQRLGDRQSLGQTIREATGIPIRALDGKSLSKFSVEERMSWSRSRTTSRPEDKAYSLLGILSVSLIANYGEGEQNAFERLWSEISIRSPFKVLGKLPVADGAIYDSHANEHDIECLEGTRTEVLREIVTWVQGPSSEAVYWLNGMAGTGKSTISRTIANNTSKGEVLGVRLGATFFFKRGEGDRGKILKFFTTISSQLIQQVPEMARHVQHAVDADPTLVSKAMQTQFEKLIQDPVSMVSVDPSCRTLLVVIDALDECEGEEDIRPLIKLLSGVPQAMTIRLKFLLTSRPDLPIRLGFSLINRKYEALILHEVAGPVVEHDLQVYLKHELEQIRLTFNQDLPEQRSLPANWPDPIDIGLLVQMATPLFIVAATLCRFIADRKGGNPEKKLRRVLESRSAQLPKLMATYMPVLEQLTMDLTFEEQNETLLEFQKIVGPIVILADPLGSKPLSQLLNVTSSDIMELLDFLHSVLQVPLSPEQPIQLLHLSFRDFLVDQKRQGDSFWIDEKKAHRQLAEGCLRVLNTSLKNDICNVQALGTTASSISASDLKTKIPQELQYACRFWSYHLRESSTADLNTTQIWDFLSLHFLQWLEVLSWIGRFPESLGMIQSLRPTMLGNHQIISDLLIDSERFISAMGTSIQMAPLQVYFSALVFSPERSFIRRLYQENISRYVGLAPRMPLFWDEKDASLLSHSGLVHSVAFSPDGQTVASASSDRTVILWSTMTGQKQATLEGHLGSVYSVAFSPDGQTIASASSDRTAILWSTMTGQKQATLEGHLGLVYSVAFSPDSRSVASASDDYTVILWSTATGQKQATLRGHIDLVYSVAFSPDGHLVASASSDHTVILWSVATGQKRRILRSGCITNLRLDSTGFAISPNNCWLTKDGQHVLWLPWRYQPSASAISAKTIVLGCSSGSVLIIQMV